MPISIAQIAQSLLEVWRVRGLEGWTSGLPPAERRGERHGFHGCERRVGGLPPADPSAVHVPNSAFPPPGARASLGGTAIAGRRSRRPPPYDPHTPPRRPPNSLPSTDPTFPAARSCFAGRGLRAHPPGPTRPHLRRRLHRGWHPTIDPGKAAPNLAVYPTSNPPNFYPSAGQPAAPLDGGRGVVLQCGDFLRKKGFNCHEERHPSEVRRRYHHLRVWQCHSHPLDGQGHELQRLLCLPPLLHGQEDRDGHRRAHR